MSIRLDTLPAVDRQTNGQTNGFAKNNIALCMCCKMTPTRDKMIFESCWMTYINTKIFDLQVWRLRP